MKRKPMIAVIMDENTSAGGTAYETSKAYFSAVGRAGGAPFGIPYLPEIVDQTVEQFDGFLSVGGRIEFPEPWYVDGDRSQYPTSDRLRVEMALMEGFLARNKPVLGVCNGMQMLACLNGCRMVSDVHASWPDALNHDQKDLRHEVLIEPGTKMASVFGTGTFSANTFHREAIVEASADVIVTARGPDGVIEGIEVPSQTFAMGVQWHPEKLAGEDHPGLRIFDAFVDAAWDRS